MRSNHMYMMPFDSPFYALIPKRRWYAPWIWDLDCVDALDPTTFSDIKPLASNLRRNEVLGMMKMLGAYLDFDKHLGDPR